MQRDDDEYDFHANGGSGSAPDLMDVAVFVVLAGIIVLAVYSMSHW